MNYPTNNLNIVALPDQRRHRHNNNNDTFSWKKNAIRSKPADCILPYNSCYVCQERVCTRARKEKT